MTFVSRTAVSSHTYLTHDRDIGQLSRTLRDAFSLLRHHTADRSGRTGTIRGHAG